MITSEFPYFVILSLITEEGCRDDNKEGFFKFDIFFEISQIEFFAASEPQQMHEAHKQGHCNCMYLTSVTPRSS